MSYVTEKKYSNAWTIYPSPKMDATTSCYHRYVDHDAVAVPPINNSFVTCIQRVNARYNYMLIVIVINTA